MKSFTTPLIFAVLGLAAGPAAASTSTVTDKAAEAKTEAKEPHSRKFLFTYEVGYGQIPKEGNAFDFWIPVPQENEHQKLSDLVAYGPGGGGIGVEMEYGNRVYHGTSGRRGGQPLSMKIRCVVDRREISFDDLTALPAIGPDPPKNLDRYLAGDKQSPIDGEIKALSGKVTKGAQTDAEKARAVFDYVVKGITLSEAGSGFGTGDLKRTISLKKGNSLDMSVAFVGLARASGIPARVVVGFKLPPRFSQGTLDGYYAWAEFYLKGLGWVPVDPAAAAASRGREGAYFGHLDANRVEFSVGQDVTLNPPQKGDPIPFFLYPYAEMDGQVLGHAAYRFTFGPPPKD